MMGGWLTALSALEAAGEPAVLVTVVAVRGSTPREAGCKMVVATTAQEGTIGGGNLEHQSTRVARAMLAGGATLPALRDFALGPALGQCCGGAASVLFEPIRPVAWRLALFGAGHVGRALVRLLGDLPCRAEWIDPREDAFPADCPANVVARIAARPQQMVAQLPADTRVLVMTHDHGLDYEIVAEALRRHDLAFVGLIGSETKRARFAHRLARDGFDQSAVARLVCPIGLAGVGSKHAAEIAISVAAQLLALRSAPVAADPPAALPVLDCGDPDCRCRDATSV
jgi:xanthine dehydrogenase accessory factor